MVSKTKKIIDKAIKFATKAHGDQVRKYTGEPYVNHTIAVSEIVKTVSNDVNMIAAAILHDTIEDTDVTREDIENNFGKKIADLVWDLTDQSVPSDGNRAARKAIDRQHTSQASPKAKTIKLADLMDNTKSIVKYDKNFAIIYLKEKRLLLDLLKEGNPTLWNKAWNVWSEATEQLEREK